MTSRVRRWPPGPSPRTAARSAVWMRASVLRSTLAVASSSASTFAPCSSALHRTHHYIVGNPYNFWFIFVTSL